jgi:hypothetical protein
MMEEPILQPNDDDVQSRSALAFNLAGVFLLVKRSHTAEWQKARTISAPAMLVALRLLCVYSFDKNL